jgi:hypothetical protein
VFRLRVDIDADHSRSMEAHCCAKHQTWRGLVTYYTVFVIDVASLNLPQSMQLVANHWREGDGVRIAELLGGALRTLTSIDRVRACV